MPEASTQSVTHFSATHNPEKRDIAKPCSPRSMKSCSVAGASTGIDTAWNTKSVCARHGRGLGTVVVAGQRQHAAMA